MAAFDASLADNVVPGVLPTFGATDRGHHNGVDAGLLSLGGGETAQYCFRGVDSGFPGPGIAYVSWTGGSVDTAPPPPPFGGPIVNIVVWRVK